MARMPVAEVTVDLPLVRRLLSDQHPDLAQLPMHVAAGGWDNMMVRLGADLVVRLPRRAAAADLVEHEQLVLPRLAAHLPVAVPVPVRTGVPTDYYPWAWTVAPWLPGDSHPLNLLAAGDQLTGVIDFGDTTAGDPATDLATAWLTFTATGRAEFIDRYTAATGADEATWRRARAWAINFAAVLLGGSDDHAALAAIGTHARGELLDQGEAPPSAD